MQLLLTFDKDPSNESKPIPNVWLTLDAEQQAATRTLLAHLLAKAAAADVLADRTTNERSNPDD
jgi:hypothetical protein